MSGGLLALLAVLPFGSPHWSLQYREQQVSTRTDIHYGKDHLQTLDSFLPSAVRTSVPAVVLVHGGAWNSGDKSKLDRLGVVIAKFGWAAFSINYRLDGFPGEVDDVQAAVRWIRTNAEALHVDSSFIALWGTSAGGTLAAEAATGAVGPAGNGSPIKAVVSWSGPMDLARLVRETPADSLPAHATERYVGCSPERCPTRYNNASPIAHVSSSTPPMFVANSTDELIPLDQATTMAARLRAAGVPVRLDVIPGNGHAVAYAASAVGPSLAFLTKYLGPSSNQSSSAFRFEV